ncbi:MAG: hypothetical protein KatS3mg061_2051 [Dehalococcoidia bacterium]|nr:MAG: hypothetical protein KatS3mg061_2051 [Dehalococcoidia bacterium]
MTVASAPGGLRRLAANSDVVLAVAVVFIVAMLIIPLPELLLDLLIILNIATALTILLVAMYTQEPLQFSVFPSVLLVATLFRLGAEHFGDAPDPAPRRGRAGDRGVRLLRRRWQLHRRWGWCSSSC